MNLTKLFELVRPFWETEYAIKVGLEYAARATSTVEQLATWREEQLAALVKFSEQVLVIASTSGDIFEDDTDKELVESIKAAKEKVEAALAKSEAAARAAKKRWKKKKPEDPNQIGVFDKEEEEDLSIGVGDPG